MAEGAGLSGAISGAGVGSKIGGLVGSAIPGGQIIGSVAGGLIGSGVGAIGANRKQKKAEDAQNIALNDPLEQKRLAALNQAVKNVSSGTDALTQNKISELNKVGAQTQNAVSKVSGGDVGATMQGLLQAQRNTQVGVNDAVSNRSQLPAFQSLAGTLAAAMSQKRLELGLLDRNQQTAEYAQGAKENNLNKMGLLATGSTQGLQDLLGSQFQMDKLAGMFGGQTPQIGLATPNAATSITAAPTLSTLQVAPVNIPGVGS